MFQIFSGSKNRDRTLSSSQELGSVQMHVYTKASGPIGRAIGRDLKLRVDQFEYTFEPRTTPLPAEEVGTTSSSKVLKSVTVMADSLVPVADVDDRKFERLLLTLQESEKVSRRTRLAVLDSARFPKITYHVDREDASSLEGRLELRGEQHPVRCTKTVDGPELVVSCLVDYTKHGAPQYGHLVGLFSVNPTVEVVSRVPMTLLL